LSWFTSSTPGSPKNTKGPGPSPATSTDNAVARWDGTNGIFLQNSLVTISDVGAMTVPTLIATNIITTGDNIITLNDDVTGAPSEDAGIEIERGTSLNAEMLWNETIDRWQFGENGSLENIIIPSELAAVAGAATVGYDDTGQPLTATNVQDAIAVAAAGSKFLELAITGFNDPFNQTKNLTYTTLAQFIYRGSDETGAIQSINVLIANEDATAYGDIRILDTTNVNVIAEVLLFNSATFTIQDLGTVSNVPTGPAVFEIQVRRNPFGTNKQSRLAGLSMAF
jgi:hypothetical protein